MEKKKRSIYNLSFLWWREVGRDKMFISLPFPPAQQHGWALERSFVQRRNLCEGERLGEEVNCNYFESKISNQNTRSLKINAPNVMIYKWWLKSYECVRKCCLIPNHFKREAKLSSEIIRFLASNHFRNRSKTLLTLLRGLMDLGHRITNPP